MRLVIGIRCNYCLELSNIELQGRPLAAATSGLGLSNIKLLDTTTVGLRRLNIKEGTVGSH
jgi:hypothetical protein